ncbi:Protein of unknown function [Bacillus thuringiensis]|uniref:Uncharacterized protein n=1 Tax=Bacillus thuringiensis TaxID=1428 RepID=A0A1C4DSQ3_BACTU|nr:Protein of unknown function [Bacillus thuringiensis]
MDIREEGFR